MQEIEMTVEGNLNYQLFIEPVLFNNNFPEFSIKKWNKNRIAYFLEDFSEMIFVFCLVFVIIPTVFFC